MRLYLCWLLLVGLPALGADWSGFRGENAAGVAEGYELPTQIDPAGGYLFKTSLPPGSSSPVVAGDLIYLTGYEGERLITLALDRASGKIQWRREIVRPRDELRHKLNNAAAASPATDGENVYVFFSDFGLVSYSPEGEERWRRELGPFINLHGMAASPVVSGSRLFAVCDQDLDSYVTALDASSGQTLWKTERPEAVHGFATPTVFTPEDDVPQLIVPGSYQVTSYELATGKKLWWARGITWQIKTTAVVDDDTVYVSGWAPGADAGKRRFFPPYEEVIALGDRDGDGKLLPDEIPEEMRHTGSWRAIDLDADGYMDARDWGFYRARWSSRNVTLAIKPAGARGDLSDSHVVWEYERAVPVVSSPLLYRGLLYTIKDGGILTVFDAATGQVRHQGRLVGAIDKYYASPVAGDSKAYLASEQGKLSVIGGETGWDIHDSPLSRER